MEKFMMMKFPPNQLNFNLNPAITPASLANRFRPPQPIIIEKQPLSREFTYVSSHSLSEAVLAAKADVQLMRNEGADARKTSQLKPSSVIINNGGTKIFNSAQICRRGEPKSKKIVVREKLAMRPSMNAVTQTRQPINASQDMPVRSWSPPTRDTAQDEKTQSEMKKAPDEISRLRIEIMKCLQQIRQFRQNETREEDSSERLRRLVRAEEQSIRLARIIYSLNKQISQVQDDLKRTDLKMLAANKKSQLVTRMASLHRAVIRALQMYIRHLSDVDVCPNILSSRSDLAAVVRQLSICYAHVDAASDSSQSDEILSLISDIVEFSRSVDASKTSISNVKNQSGMQRVQSDIEGTSKSSSATQSGPSKVSNAERKYELRARIQQLMNENEQPYTTRSEPVSKKVNKVQTQLRTGARSVLIGRPNQVLKAVERDGMTAHYADSTVSTALKEHGKFQPPSRSNTKPPRASIGKEVSGVHRRRSRSLSPFRPCGCPRHSDFSSTRSHSVTDRTRGSALDSRSISGGTSGTTVTSSLVTGDDGLRRETMRNDFIYGEQSARPSSWNVVYDRDSLDQSTRQTSRTTVSDRASMNPSSKQSSSTLVSNRNPSDQSTRQTSRTTVSDMNQFSRQSSRSVIHDGASKGSMQASSIEELLSEASFWKPITVDESKPNESTVSQRTSLQSASDLSQKSSVSANVSDLLVNDLVSDISSELHQFRRDNIADHQSAFLRDIPSVRSLLERLREMEAEQDAIRQRWTTIVYDDNGAVDANLDDPSQSVPDSGPGSNAILFTKPSVADVRRRQAEPNDTPASRAAPQTAVRLTNEAVRRIQDNVENYEEFLRIRSHNVGSKFNPWNALDLIAEDVLRGCIEDVVGEMSQISNELVDNLYSSEFAIVQ